MSNDRRCSNRRRTENICLNRGFIIEVETLEVGGEGSRMNQGIEAERMEDEF